MDALHKKNSQFIKNYQDFCPNHGNTNFVQVLDNPPECQLCQMARHKKEDEARAKQVYQKMIAGKMRDCGINDKDLSAWVIDDAQKERQTVLIENIKAYAEFLTDKSPNILLIGNTGTGKTLISNHIAKVVFSKSRKVQLIKTSAITRQIKDSWSNKSLPSEQSILNKLAKLDLLILDDLGDGDIANGEMGNSDRLRFGQLIDLRYQKRPTIITTNLTSDNVARFLGDRAWDRFAQNLIIIECNWQSYRQKTANIQSW